jgi:hypothetical protein
MDVDPEAMDRLARLFAEARELGLVISDAMPLDTPEHQRLAVVYLSRAIERAKRGWPRWL